MRYESSPFFSNKQIRFGLNPSLSWFQYYSNLFQFFPILKIVFQRRDESSLFFSKKQTRSGLNPSLPWFVSNIIQIYSNSFQSWKSCSNGETKVRHFFQTNKQTNSFRIKPITTVIRFQYYSNSFQLWKSYSNDKTKVRHFFQTNKLVPD